ncbi:hypothetical protein F444_06941 [Phytophthora nicotianae P1976]|uniref:Uncharacterized protein n=1 Tax=Phytophthora nicotianae P1976 TaxID=1317066 RepID=A0A081AGE0_PHYNI|nr:hypothetical protein F444_06941 [Phytophthora nicotianae P1976]
MSEMSQFSMPTESDSDRPSRGQTITSGHAIHAERRLHQRFTFACDFSAVCHAACLAEASNRTGSPPRDLSVVLSSIKAQF